MYTVHALCDVHDPHSIQNLRARKIDYYSSVLERPTALFDIKISYFVPINTKSVY